MTSLREYQKLYEPKTQTMPNKNNLVLVFYDKQPREKWLLVKIDCSKGISRKNPKYCRPTFNWTLSGGNDFSGFF